MMLLLPRGCGDRRGSGSTIFARKMPLLQLIYTLLLLIAMSSSITSSPSTNSNRRFHRRSRRRLEDTGPFSSGLDPDLAIDMARQSIKFHRCYALNYAEAVEPEWPYEEEKEEEEVHHDDHDGIGDGYFPEPLPAEAIRPDPVPLRYRPVWFNRIDGWNGQTYIEAVKFCEEKLAGLCPYEAICPEGMRTEPVDGYRNEELSGSYVPVIDRDNTWVTVSGANGPEDSCIVSNPEWGMEGEGNEEMTGHVACCQTVQEPQAAEEAEGWGGPWAGGLHEGDHEDEQQEEEIEVEELEVFAELEEEENMDEEAGGEDQQGGGLRKRMRKGTRRRRLDQDELDSTKFVTFRMCYGTSTCDESCNRAFGEYTMDMETYLDVTLSYMQEVQQGSCNLCDECVALFWTEGVKGQKFSQKCPSVDITTCRDGCLNLENMEADGLIDASELIECQLIQDDETTNEILYAGATCSSDGSRIEIGVFRDEFCTDRDHSKDVQDYLMDDAGNIMKLDNNLLMQTYKPDGCVASCLSENSVEVNMNNNQNQNYYNNANGNQGAALDNANWNQGAAPAVIPEINEVCEYLHQFSSLIALQNGNDYNYDDDMEAIWEEEVVTDMEYPDLAKYSIKFESCNEERFEEEEAITDIFGNVEDGEVKAPMIGIQSTVSFRFCPNESLYADDCEGTCDSGFETMVVDMKTYLKVTLGYRQEAQFQYCDECKECTMLDEDGIGAPSLRKCAGIDTIECNAECGDIENMEENGYIDASTYRNCQMIHRANNEVYYAGPKCSSGGRQFEIGIFLDADCTFPDATKNVEAYLPNEDGFQMKLSYKLFNTVTGAASLSSIRPNCHVAQCLEEDGIVNQNQNLAVNSNGQESAIEFGYRINQVCEVLYHESMQMGFEHDDHDEYYYGEGDGGTVDYVMAIDYKERDYNALALFYRMARGQSWDRNDLWLDDDASMCDWHGVGCNEGGSVTSLELSNNSILGSFGHSISQLANLTTLDLSNNEIVGVVGEEIGDLQRLTHLKLGNNRMRGRIPSSLSRLLQLESLELQGNQFSGFPMEEFSRASLVNLTRVDLSSNLIKSTLPHQAFSENPKLSYLNISRNHFVGTIGAGIMQASLGSPLLKDPVVIDLSFNNFEGMIPDFENDRLTLNVVGNRLTGIDQAACGRQWNEGASFKYECDGIACPMGTSNSEGRQTSEDNPCVPCDVAKYVGNVGCEEINDGNVFGQDGEIVPWPIIPPTKPPQPVRVNYELWISLADAASRDFLLNFQETALKLQGYAYFTPRFFLYDCSDGDAEDTCDRLCTNSGRYCATEPDDAFGGGISGADVVRESYRWLCISQISRNYQVAETKWWDYVNFFLNECATGLFADEECVLTAMIESCIDPELISQCMEDYGGLDDEMNKLLEEQIYMKQEQEVTIVPTLLVDGIPIKGQLNPSNALGAICAGFMAGAAALPGVCPPAQTDNEDVSDKFNMGSGSSSHAYNQSLTWGSQSNMTSFNSTGNYSTYNSTASNNTASEPSSSPFSEPSQAPSNATLMPMVAPTSAPTEFEDDLAPDNAGGTIVLFWQSSMLLLTSIIFL